MRDATRRIGGDSRVVGASHEDHPALHSTPGSDGQAGESLRNVERDFRRFLECQIPIVQKAWQAITIEGGTTRDQSAV